MNDFNSQLIKWQNGQFEVLADDKSMGHYSLTGFHNCESENFEAEFNVHSVLK